MNFAAPFKEAISRPLPIANSRQDLIVEWRGWNPSVDDRCWMSWQCKLNANGQ